MKNDTTFKAPKLIFNGAKTQDNEQTNQSYLIPQHLCDIIFDVLGDKPAQMKIMLVLCGTKEGFAISNKWICDRTHLVQQSYNKCLKELVKIGWVSHIPYKSITINYDVIYAAAKNEDDSN